MQSFRHPTLNDAAWLAEAYQTQSLTEIAHILEVSSSSVLRALIAHGIERRSRNTRLRPIQHPLLSDREWLAERYATATIQELAASLSVNKATVSRALDIHGIPKHTPSRANAIRRRPELDDAEWLANQYETRAPAEIAADLGVPAQAVLRAMVRNHVQQRTRSESSAMRRPSLLDDPDDLAAALESAKVVDLAAELGVAVPTIHLALRRQRVQSPRRYNGWTRHSVPPRDVLESAWESDETIKGVARRLEVSPTTAAIWLAQIGIFASDTPALSKNDLIAAIRNEDSIETIRRRHSVGTQTVTVELHRHGLYQAHKRRHMSTTGSDHQA